LPGTDFTNVAENTTKNSDYSPEIPKDLEQVADFKSVPDARSNASGKE
jgi:hypothetical protein